MSVLFGKTLLLCVLIGSIIAFVRARSKAKDDEQMRKALLIPIGFLSVLLVGFVLYSFEVFGFAPVIADHWDGPKDNKLPSAVPEAPDPPEDKSKTNKEETAQAVEEQKKLLDDFER